MKINIYDIAREADTSISTVSRYLNKKNVRPETKKRIEEVISKYNYRPSAIAKGLVAHSMKTVAVFVVDIRMPHYANAAYYIDNELSKYGYRTIICNTMGELSTIFKYVDEVSEIVHLDFPDEGYCDYLVVDGKGNFEMMVRFSDQNEVMKVINASSFTKQLEPTIYMNLPVSYQLTIKDYDYYLIYDADNRLYNESIEGESYVLCYKETTNLLYCFSLNR